ncbi:LmeA family phospholipid-binding protein [Nocardia sp. CA-084685]|uniref:LmeA family phospholipid-binding protein n=1 Tax=Nocardia sp. CA-084685 TaxID=3239970 RepID=UPI003D99B3A8
MSQPSEINAATKRPPPRGNRRALVIALVVVTILLATVLVGGEAYARHQVSRCISSQFEKDMGSKIDVSFGAKPMLITWIDGKVDQVKVNSDDSKFGPAVGMVVHAKFNDLEVSNNSGSTIGSSSADVTWGNDGIRETLGGLVSGVSSASSTGMLTLDVLGGLAQLQVKPVIKDGTVQIETKSAALLGMGIPTDVVSGIVEVFTQSLQSYPLGLKATDVKVTDNGVVVKLAGGRTELPAQNGDVSC